MTTHKIKNETKWNKIMYSQNKTSLLIEGNFGPSAPKIFSSGNKNTSSHNQEISASEPTMFIEKKLEKMGIETSEKKSSTP